MRISEDRYFRELRPLLLADWMLRLEARTQTICTWTGLSRDRIRKLAASIAPRQGKKASVRHRGRSPHQTAYFFRSPHLCAHASVLGSYLAMVDLLPPPPAVIPAKDFPSVPRGERLCETYEFYSLAYPSVPIDFERAILLATALAQRAELDLARCGDCGGLMVIDLMAQRMEAPLCHACKIPDSTATTSLGFNESGLSYPEQMQLFEPTDRTGSQLLNGSVSDFRATETLGRDSGSVAATVESTEHEDSTRDMPRSDNDSE